MSMIKAVLIANTKSWGKIGDERDVTAADLAKYPHILRAKSEVESEEARRMAEQPKSTHDWHQEQRAKLREERARVEEQQALLAAERAEMERRRAEEAAERARKVREEAKAAEEMDRLRAENELLRQRQAQRDEAEKALSELQQNPAQPQKPEAPKEDAPAKAPHERKRDR